MCRFTRVLCREPHWKFDDLARARDLLELFGCLRPCGPKLRADHDNSRARRLQQDQRIGEVGGRQRAVSGFLEQLAEIRQHVRRLVHAQHIRVVERSVDALTAAMEVGDRVGFGRVGLKHRLEPRDPKHVVNLWRDRADFQ